MKKIVLIQPSSYDHNKKPLKKKKLYFAGLALPLLAALTPKDYEVEIIFLTKAYWTLYESLFTLRSIAKRNLFRKEFLKAPGKYLFYSVVNLYYRRQIKQRVIPNIF